MSRNFKNHVRLSVEELEGRQLLSTLPAPLPPAAGQPGAAPLVAAPAQATAPLPMTWTYAVVSLRNPTNVTLTVQFRWTGTSAWASYTVPPHGYRYFYFTSWETPAPQVRFDADTSAGYRPAVATLRYRTIRTSGTPAYGDAYHYAFALHGHILTLSPSST
jgi:hypothetical protein